MIWEIIWTNMDKYGMGIIFMEKQWHTNFLRHGMEWDTLFLENPRCCGWVSCSYMPACISAVWCKCENFDWGVTFYSQWKDIKKKHYSWWLKSEPPPIFWLVRSPPACHRNPFVLEKPGHGGMARLHASDFRSFSQLEPAMRHGGFWNDHGWLGALGLESVLIGEGFSQDGSPQPSSLTLPQINIDSIRLDMCNCQSLS